MGHHSTLMKIWKLLDAYVTCIRQVAALLGYGKSQVLGVFKNTLPSRLHLVLFPIEDLRQAFDTAKRILTKNRQTTCGSITIYTIYEYTKWV